jgi:integrase
MASKIEAHEAKLRLAEPSRPEALFPEVVDAWIVYLETEKRVKPSTLAGYKRLLVRPGRSRDLRRGRIMREFEKRLLLDIKTKDARRFLAKLDREDISARTVNIHRQILHAIFEFAQRDFGLSSNAFADTAKRPEDGAKPIETFEPDELLAIAEVARIGAHRRRGGYAHSKYGPEADREWWRTNEQDAALFTIAACTGLRLGELVALRWRDADLRGGVLTVSRAISAGEETSTKSRRSRTVPLAEQAIAAFKRLLERDNFKNRDDFVFCGPAGGRLDGSAVRARFIRAQKKAQLRVRRFHDLRHTFGTLAIRRFDLVSVKEMMGHAQLSTTERYLHSKPRPSDAAKLTALFSEDDDHNHPLAA